MNHWKFLREKANKIVLNNLSVDSRYIKGFEKSCHRPSPSTSSACPALQFGEEY